MPKKTKRQIGRITSFGSTASTRSTEFNPDYSDTKKDLQRIGVLAGVFFAILIALKFFLN